MIGTIAIETGPYAASRFTPRMELYNDPPGRDAYFESMYGLGHHRDAPTMQSCPGSPAVVGDGARYPGRGLIQITWKSNYYKYGLRIGVDLVKDPDKALEPNNAAKIAALYWVDRDIQAMADRRDWTAVRAAVQGGSLGLDHLVDIVGQLAA